MSATSLRVRPFRALRPRAEWVSEVASVPYDVCNRDEAVSLAEGKARSFLHVVRPDIDLPPETDPYSDIVYETARTSFARLRAEGVFVQEDEPSLYVYRQRMELHGHVIEQTGVVGCCHVDDYRSGVIKRHEKTRKKKEDDRTRHVLTLRAQTGPVFVLHRDHDEVAACLAEVTSTKPLYDFCAPDGVHHSVWRVVSGDALVNAYASLGEAYVADGHHRSASASRAAEALSDDPAGSEAEWFLAGLFPSSQLHVLPYNRHVTDLNGLSPQEFLERLGEVAKVEVTQGPRRVYARGTVGFFIAGLWYEASWKESVAEDDPVASLDYVVLYERVLSPILGIGEVRTDPRIDFVGGIRGPSALSDRVQQEGGVAFLMPAVTVEQLMAVSDAGSIMPPKSTWFEPKLRSGLLVHLFD